MKSSLKRLNLFALLLLVGGPFTIVKTALAQPLPQSAIAQASPAQITDIQLEATESGLQVLLISTDEFAPKTTTVSGNTLVAEISNARLSLPESDNFLASNPTAEIAAIQVTALSGNRVQIVITLLTAIIPQPPAPDTPLTLRKDLAVGFHYLAQRPGMVGSLVTAALFQFIFQITSALHAPMILARSGGSAQVLATVYATAGVGGVLGAILITTWGGPRPRIYGVLFGMIGAGLSRAGFSVGHSLTLWMPMQFCLSFNFPMMGSSGNAIWLSKVPPDLQGRVFSISLLIKGLMAPMGRLVAGPLADRVFEPAMIPGGRLVPIFGTLFGTGRGAGMATLCGIASLAMTLVGLCGFLYQPLSTVETTLPDHKVTHSQT